MSSHMTAWEYLVHSHDKILWQNIHRVFPLLSSVLQHILDWKYQKQRGSHIHSIYPNDGSDTLYGNIVGVSLGEGKETKFLTNKQSVQDCITGVPWSIRILYESNGEIIGIELSTIEKITTEIVDQNIRQYLPNININSSEIGPWVAPNPQKIIAEAIVA